MKATDVTRGLHQALENAEVDPDRLPRLLSDNGSCYVSGSLADYLSQVGMDHVRGAPHHPQTQGKIERWHRSMKNVVKLEHYYSPEQLTYRLREFVEYYNHQRYHESLSNVTPADVYFGREQQILQKRKSLKQVTLHQRRKNHRCKT